MQEQLQHLNVLLEDLPSSTSCRGFSDLNIILSKYTKILNFVNSYNDNYKRATSLYYNDISFIRDNIELSVNAARPEEKDVTYKSARDKLKKEIEALSILIKPQQELVELAV